MGCNDFAYCPECDAHDEPQSYCHLCDAELAEGVTLCERCTDAAAIATRVILPALRRVRACDLVALHWERVLAADGAAYDEYLRSRLPAPPIVPGDMRPTLAPPALVAS
jgi:hypothetical protein